MSPLMPLCASACSTTPEHKDPTSHTLQKRRCVTGASLSIGPGRAYPATVVVRRAKACPAAWYARHKSAGFYRAEDELTRQTRGTGIGLALVKVLATTMHTTVHMHKRYPGAEFQLTLPTVYEGANRGGTYPPSFPRPRNILGL
jgi:hypothetical protein